MSSSIKLTNSSGKIVTITNPDTTSADVAVDLLNNAYTIATVNDFGIVPVGYTTVIVKDTDRGGVFNRIASTTANGGTIFSGTTGYSWERQYSGAVNVKWFGAKGDGVTDDTAAMQNAINLFDNIYIPEGIFKCNLTNVWNLRGESFDRTILQSYDRTAGSVILKLRDGDTSWYYKNISHLTIDGEDKTVDGIHFGNYVSGRWNITNIYFFDCDRALRKPNGNIGNYIAHCNFARNNFGYYAVNADKQGFVQHTGNDLIMHCEFNSNELAAIWIHGGVFIKPGGGLVGGGQTTIQDCVIEYNKGFGVFVVAYPAAVVPLVLSRIWGETNCTSTVDIVLNGVTHTPSELRDVFIKDTPRFIIKDSRLDKCEFVGSTGYLQDCLTTTITKSQSIINELTTIGKMNIKDGTTGLTTNLNPVLANKVSIVYDGIAQSTKAAVGATISRVSAGLYDVVFKEAMETPWYTVGITISTSEATVVNWVGSVIQDSETVNGFRVKTGYSSDTITFTKADNKRINIVVTTS